MKAVSLADSMAGKRAGVRVDYSAVEKVEMKVEHWAAMKAGVKAVPWEEKMVDPMAV